MTLGSAYASAASITPGATELQVTPWRATSTATWRSSDSIAALVAAYTDSPAPAGKLREADALEIWTTRPQPRSHMPASTACTQYIAP